MNKLFSILRINLRRAIRRGPALSTIHLLLADLRQQIDAVDGSGNAHSLAFRFLHPHHRGLAERPPSRPKSQARRQHDNQFQLRARFHPRLGIEKNARRTQIARQALVLAALVTHLDRDANRHALARTPVGCSLLRHMLWKCTALCEKRGRWNDSPKKRSSRTFARGAGEKTGYQS